jgi:hypothetical protein
MTKIFTDDNAFVTEDLTGSNGVNLTKLAFIVGVSHVAVIGWIKKIEENNKVPNIFKEFVIGTKSIYWDNDYQKKSGKSIFVSSSFTWALISYYSDSTSNGAGKRVTPEAIANIQNIGQLGMDHYIHDKTGYQIHKGDRTEIISVDRQIAEYELRINKLVEKNRELIKENKYHYEINQRISDENELENTRMFNEIMRIKQNHEELLEGYQQLLAEPMENYAVMEGYAAKVAGTMHSRRLFLYLGEEALEMLQQVSVQSLLLDFLAQEFKFIFDMMSGIPIEQWHKMVNFSALHDAQEKSESDAWGSALDYQFIWEMLPVTIKRIHESFSLALNNISPFGEDAEGHQKIIQVLTPYLKRHKTDKLENFITLMGYIKRPLTEMETKMADFKEKMVHETPEDFHNRITELMLTRWRESKIVDQLLPQRIVQKS